MTPRPAPRLAIAPFWTDQAFVAETQPSRVLPSNSGVMLAILARAAGDNGAENEAFSTGAVAGDETGAAVCCCANRWIERPHITTSEQTIFLTPCAESWYSA